MSVDSPPREYFKRSQWAVMGGCLLLFVVLGLITGYQMRPWVDEAWYGVPALTLTNFGYFGSPSFDGSLWGLKDIDHFSYWVMPRVSSCAVFVGFGFSSDLAFHPNRFHSKWSRCNCMLDHFFLPANRKPFGDRNFLCACLSRLNWLTSAAGFGRPDMMAFMFQAAAFAAYMLLRERNFLGRGLKKPNLRCS